MLTNSVAALMDYGIYNCFAGKRRGFIVYFIHSLYLYFYGIDMKPRHVRRDKKDIVMQ